MEILEKFPKKFPEQKSSEFFTKKNTITLEIDKDNLTKKLIGHFEIWIFLYKKIIFYIQCNERCYHKKKHHLKISSKLSLLSDHCNAIMSDSGFNPL